MSARVSATKAAEIIGCSESFIRKLIKRGELTSAEKVRGRWSIARADLDSVTVGAPMRTVRTGEADGADESHSASEADGVDEPHSANEADGADERSAHANESPDWRDDLLAQVARLEANEDHWRNEMERSKARVIDLERELTVRDSRIADLQAKQETEASELRGQVAILEAKVREVLEDGKGEAVRLADRIADLVVAQQDMHSRVIELQPVADRVPMLQAAVEETEANLSERERELGNMRQDIDAIASRPVTGPVFRLLTRGGRLRR